MRSRFLLILLLILIGFSPSIRSVSSQASSSLPNAEIVFLTNGGSEYFYPGLVNPDGSHDRYLTIQYGDQQLNPSIDNMDCSKDGQFIIFAEPGLYRINADGSQLKLVSYQGLFDDITLSSDDSKIAFIGFLIPPGADTSENLYVMGVDGSNIVQVTHDHDAHSYPTWSPDGQRLAFGYDDNDIYGIGEIDADGTNEVRITEGNTDDDQPDWSPDGQHIVFVSDRDGLKNIYTINPDGSNLVQLTRNAGNNTYPRWSPDSQFISFSSDRGGGGSEIYLMRADGSAIRRLTHSTSASTEHRNQCWLVRTTTPEATPPT